LFKIVLSEPPPLRDLVTGLDPAFESIVLKAMAGNPEHRFESAAEMVEALDGWARTGQPVTVPPSSPVDERIAAAIPGARASQTSVHTMRESGLIRDEPGRATAATLESGPSTFGPTGAPRPKTVDSWAASQPDAPIIPKRNNTPIVIGLAAVVLLLAAGSFAIVRTLSSGTDGASAATSEPPQSPVSEPKAADETKKGAQDPTAQASGAPAASVASIAPEGLKQTPSAEPSAAPTVTAPLAKAATAPPKVRAAPPRAKPPKATAAAAVRQPPARAKPSPAPAKTSKPIEHGHDFGY
jgi:hypothetical protein